MRMKLALLLVFLLLLPQSVMAYYEHYKYEDIFYPDGIPVVDGKSPVYGFLDECIVPGTNRTVVLYSENYEFVREEFSEEVGHEVYDFDIPRRVFIGVLEKDGDKLSAVNKTDISEKVFDSYTLEEGCKELSGNVSAIDVFKDIRFFKLSIDVLLAGNGHIEFTSVYLFNLDKNGIPTIVLDLGDVSGFGQARHDNYGENSTKIYAAEVGGVPEILTRGESYEVDAEHQVYREMVEDGYSVYKYDVKEHVFKPSKTVHKLPAGAKEMFE